MIPFIGTAPLLDLQQGKMKQLSGRDPREYNFPALASVLLGALLLTFGFNVGFGHAAFWVVAGACIALIAALERRLRRFVEAWGDDADLILTRAGHFEKVPWRDVEVVENKYSSRCVVRFRRDTQFGRTLSFSLPVTDRLIGFEHPNAVWMLQRVEAGRSVDTQG